ncbi:unnamed protein product, partial [Prunus brigantina]
FFFFFFGRKIGLIGKIETQHYQQNNQDHRTRILDI